MRRRARTAGASEIAGIPHKRTDNAKFERTLVRRLNSLTQRWWALTGSNFEPKPLVDKA